MNHVNDSNLHIRSNIYPVHAEEDGRVNFFSQKNRRFLSRVMDRPALRKLVQLEHGGIGGDEHIRKYLARMPGISTLQVRVATTPLGCALARSGDRPWGLVLRDGEYREICRCQEIDCSRYSIECRREEIGDARAERD